MPDYFSLAPDWVCEILSPSTARHDRGAKLRAYHRHRVSWAWLIDPGVGTLEVFRADSGGWMLLAVLTEDEEIAAPPFEAVRFRLGELWRR